jgi:hypothetical protein
MTRPAARPATPRQQQREAATLTVRAPALRCYQQVPVTVSLVEQLVERAVQQLAAPTQCQVPSVSNLL